MRVALGFKAHSGWAAVVCVGAAREGVRIIDRRRAELVEADAEWAKQPYHAAEHLEARQAQALIERAIECARRMTCQQVHDLLHHYRAEQHDIVACAVLQPDPMPEWTTAQILAVHFRMHKAEGVMFPDALCSATRECGVPLTIVPEKQLESLAEQRLGLSGEQLTKQLAALGKAVGAPWGKDQKSATLAAALALRVRRLN